MSAPVKKGEKGSYVDDFDEFDKDEEVVALDDDDIALLKTYGLGPYTAKLKKIDDDIKAITKRVNEASGVKETDTGLAPPSQWDVVADKHMMQQEQPLQVCEIFQRLTPSFSFSIIINRLFWYQSVS